MKKENLIWLAVGGLIVYLYLSNKNKEQKVAATTDTPTPTGTKTLAQQGAAVMSNEELLNYYKNVICTRVTGVRMERPAPSPAQLEMNEAVKAELAKRNLTGKCIDYGNFPPPATMK